MLTNELKRRVYLKMRECMDIIFQKYGIMLPIFDVEYTLTSGVAGKAFYTQDLIKLNPILLAQNPDAFIARTVPHEYAHMAAYVIYGREGTGHGDRWIEVMQALGVKDISRCHTYDTSNVIRREKPYVWGCPVCKAEVRKTAQTHGKWLRRSMVHIGCNAAMKFLREE